MSYTLNAFIKKARIPTAAAIQERIGGRVVFDALADLSLANGFVPVILDGAPTGFELYPDPIDEKQRDAQRRRLARRNETTSELLEILLGSDLDMAFSCKAGEPREVLAARLVAMAVAELAQGWFTDPQTGETVHYEKR